MTVFCDQVNYGGGWTLVMKQWGVDKPDGSGWNSASGVKENSCRNLAGYSGPESGDGESDTCKFSDATINAIKTSTNYGRIRGDWKGNNDDTTTGNRDTHTLGCSTNGYGHTCQFEEHGFGSGSCEVHSDALIADGPISCDQCVSEKDANAYSQNQFPTSAASSWTHGGTYGWMCGWNDGWDGIATGYSFDSVRRSIVSGAHHGDTQGARIDFRVWVR
jgi:hypothetical protein